MNENETSRYQNEWDETKAMLRGKFWPKCTNQKIRKIEIQSNFPS